MSLTTSQNGKNMQQAALARPHSSLATSFLHVGGVDWCLVGKLRALEDTVPLLVALEAKSLLMESFTLMRIQSPSDGIKVNSARV
jgi:hypothetical protein